MGRLFSMRQNRSSQDGAGMIGRKQSRTSDVDTDNVELKGFDDFELRLGDTMRGERATMGKSLLDVQRELRIKASYIAAIENSDPSSFDTPGFIAGYVRSYARYLNMDPDEAFAAFCAESGFEVAHGMSAAASRAKRSDDNAAAHANAPKRDPFTAPNTPFIPTSESAFSQIEPKAIGSVLVLMALIGGIGYGGWSVLKQVQQVQMAPVEQAPVVLSDLDPLQSVTSPNSETDIAPTADALDRLYRPQALDVPVLVARDAPISTLDPRNVGAFRQPESPSIQVAGSVDAFDPRREAQGTQGGFVPQVVEDSAPQLRMVAVRPSWVRVRAADGSVIFEGIMEGGESYDIPLTEDAPTLRAGESGAVYFAMGDQHYGPVGERGRVTSNLPLSIASIQERYEVADLDQDQDLARLVAEAQTGPVQP